MVLAVTSCINFLIAGAAHCLFLLFLFQIIIFGRCGVQCFYIPRSNPDGYAVTLWCVDAGQVESHEVRTFDGNNWEQFIEGSGIQAFSTPNTQEL